MPRLSKRNLIHVVLAIFLLSETAVQAFAPEHQAAILTVPNPEQPSNIVTPTILPNVSGTVSITDSGFLPETITVTVGSEVTWINNGGQGHGVTLLSNISSFELFLPVVLKHSAAPSPDTGPVSRGNDPGLVERLSEQPALWSSGLLLPGESFSRPFNEIGSFSYFNSEEPDKTGMVVVQPANEVPTISITSPAAGATVGVGNIIVNGTWADDGADVDVLVNGVLAAQSGNSFQATIPLASGNQSIIAEVTDNQGATAVDSLVILVDGQGPAIQIVTPKNRQSVYTLQPTLDIVYSDFGSSVDTNSFVATLTRHGGADTDVTDDLTIMANGASGVLTNLLIEDSSYTLSAAMDDSLGNSTLVTTTFYVPLDPASIAPPEQGDRPGWVSGMVYNSSSCDTELTSCTGLAGARVTVEEVQVQALVQVRAQRQNQTMARVASNEPFTPLDPANSTVTTAIPGTTITGPDGFFAFPLKQTGIYWLRVEKDGFTYGQRELAVVREHSSTANDVYLTPIDPAVTDCDDNGCFHSNSDDSIRLDIPAGAIGSGQVVSVTATLFDNVEFLPSGELPPGTWETYALNLGGASEITFTLPVTLQLANELEFTAGITIPLGYWNQNTQQWEHAGIGTVEPTGQWIETAISHFSNYDLNFPGTLSDVEIDVGGDEFDPDSEQDKPGDEEDEECGAGSGGCFINFKSGTVHEWVDTPPLNILGDWVGQQLSYSTDQANPSEVIDVRVTLKDTGSVLSYGYMGYELHIEGYKTATHYVPVSLNATGELGRFRYFWDGRNAQGDLLPPGAYPYRVKLTFPYLAEYCRPFGGIFGNEPNCITGGTGRYVRAEKVVWSEGTVTLHGTEDSPYGTGWVLNGQQQLFEDEAGNILIADGGRHDEFYFPQKDQLRISVATLDARPPSPAVQPAESHTRGEEGARPEYRREPYQPAARETPPAAAPQPTMPQLAPYAEQKSVALDAGPNAVGVCGAIDSNTTWFSASSPYVITCDVSIAANATLTIEAGVVVQFQAGMSLIVAGGLVADGLEGSPIIFESANAQIPGSWDQIAYMDGSSGTLDWVEVRHGGSDPSSTPLFGAVTIASDNVALTRATFIKNGVAVFVTGGSSPTINSSTFISNTARYGAAIYISEAGIPTVQSSHFEGNLTSYNGGAIYAQESSPIIQDNYFINNISDGYGGAIALPWMGAATIYNNYFEGNSANLGGGVFVYNEIAQSTIISNTFFANNSTSEGGAIYDESHQGLIRANTFISNTARAGGALSHYDYFDSPFSTIIENNSFISGEARDGGGIYIAVGDPLINNNIFANNVAEYGGAMEIYGAPRLFHNVIWNNVAGSGGGIANFESYALPQIYNNIIVSNTATYTTSNGWQGGGGIYNGTFFNYVSLGDNNIVWGNEGLDYQEMVPGEHDIAADPLFVDPGNLDFHLQPGSPAIDAGNPAYDFGDDVDGEQRPMGLAPDIGIDETPTFGVDMQGLPASVGPGEIISYVLQVINPEIQTVSAAISSTLPQEFSFVGSLSPTFNCTHDGQAWGGVLNCSVELGAGGQDGITVTMRADDSLNAPLQAVLIVEGHAGLAVARDLNELWLSWCRVQVNDGAIAEDLLAAVKASKEGDLIKVSGRCLVPGGIGLYGRTLQGGWNREFNVRFPTFYTTTLDAAYQDAVLGVRGPATVEGFVITHGAGQGVLAYDNALIQNNIIEHNIAGGVWVADVATIRNNIIRDNVDDSGGGITVRTEDNNLLVENNLITNNWASNNGGGINVVWKGWVRNNIVLGNEAEGSGGGLSFNSRNRNPIIEHNTFFGNSASEQGGGLGLTSNFGWLTTDIIRNNAVISNTAPEGGGIFLTSPMVGLDYNNVWGNSGGDYNIGTTVPVHDISGDPRFVDAAGGDFHLLPGSPMIDAADPLTTFYPDFEGDPRPMGEGGSDIGADEFPALTAFSRTATDYSRLEYDPLNNTYSRLYLDKTLVHFNADNRHEYTLSPDGTRTAYSYNPDGSVAEVAITPPGEGSPRWTWSYAYSDGKLTSITDTAGRVTEFSIDQNNHLAAVALPDGAGRGFVYDEQGLMSQQVDQNGAISDYQYDDLGRLRQVTEPAREVYDPQNGTSSMVREVRTLTSSDTGYPLLNFGAAGTPASPGTPVPLSVQLVDKMIFGRGSVSGRTDRWGFWAYEKDGLGRLTRYFRNLDGTVDRLFTPDNNCVDYTYDERGNVLSEARMGFDQCITAPVNRDPAQVQTWRWTYEARFNQVKSETDPNGHTTDYLYDYEVGAGQAGRLVQITYPGVDNGNGVLTRPTELFNYNTWGLIESEVDRRGVVTKYIYTQGTAAEASGGGNPLFAAGVTPVPGHLTQVILDYGGENLSNIYKEFGGAGNPGVTVGPDGHETTNFSYDAMNRIVQETDAVGVETTTGYDGRGNMIQQIIDPGGKNVITTIDYNPHDQLVSQQINDGFVIVATSLKYDINRKPVLKVDGRGNQTVYLYDDADQLINVIDPTGYVITYTYALDGEPLEIVDASGSITHYEYDEFDRRTTEIVDSGDLDLMNTFGYDIKGNRISATDPAGTTTCYEYDALDRLAAEIKDCGGADLRRSFSYDLNGNILSETDNRGVVTRHEYDALNREILVVMDDGGLNLQGQYEYDAAGNLAQVQDERNYVHTMAYDVLNRTSSVCEDINNLNLCTTYTYDSLGNLSTITDPEGQVSLSTFNGFGLEIETIQDFGGLGNKTGYAYDNTLNKIQAADGNGNVTNYSFGQRNDLLVERYADGTTVAYSYESRGFMSTRTNQDGDMISHEYDGAGRLLRKNFSTGGLQEYAYDAANRMTSAGETANGHQTLVQVGYSPIGDIITTTDTVDGKSWSTSYEYDHAAGVYTLTYPSGVQRVRDLEVLGRINTIRDGAGVFIAEYDYQDQAGYGTLTYANGTVNRNEYDAIGRTTRVSSDVGDYRYGYDGAGNRMYMQRAHLNIQPADVYEYDSLYRPVQVWYGADALDPSNITSSDSNHQFTLDLLANRLELDRDGSAEIYGPNNGQQLTNAMNRYELVAGQVITYDARGNTLSDGQNSYSYDILNRQIGVSGPGGNSEYVYNALGMRVAKNVDGVTSYYVYDIDKQVLEERAANDDLLARFTYGMGVDYPLLMERNGESYYYHRDAQGSITEVSKANGDLVEQYTYDIYGLVHMADGTGNALLASAISNPYLYTARRYDPESGNYYFRARNYSPDLGRFLQMDPIGYLDGMNLYAGYFVIKTSDPSGLAIELFSGCLALGVGVCISAEIDGDFSACCKDGQQREHGKRQYKAKISASVGLGIGGELKIAGTGANLNIKGPRLEAELNYVTQNSVCGGPLDTGTVCEVRGINFGTTGGIGALGFSLSYDMKMQGQFKVCATSSPGQISAEAKFCGTITLEVDYQIFVFKGNIWKHKNSKESVCKVIASNSWALPE